MLLPLPMLYCCSLINVIGMYLCICLWSNLVHRATSVQDRFDYYDEYSPDDLPYAWSLLHLSFYINATWMYSSLQTQIIRWQRSYDSLDQLINALLWSQHYHADAVEHAIISHIKAKSVAEFHQFAHMDPEEDEHEATMHMVNATMLSLIKPSTLIQLFDAATRPATPQDDVPDCDYDFI